MARKFVYFDILTTNFGPTAEIVQIGAVGSSKEVPDFSVHILPRGEISSDATQIHGIEKKSGKLVLRGNPIPSVTSYQGLEQFQNWILKYFYENSVVLVSHNAFDFGGPLLIRELFSNGYDEEDLEGLIHGFADTVPTFQHFYPGLESYSLESLLKQFAIPVNRLPDAKQNSLYLLNLISVGSRRKEVRLDPFVMMNFKDITKFL